MQNSDTKPWTKNGTYQQSIPNTFNVNVTVPLGPIPLSVGVGVQGSFNLPYDVSLLPGSSMLSFTPHVDCEVFAQAGIGGSIGPLGAEAGVDVAFTLVNDTLLVAAKVDQGSDAKGHFITEMYTVSDNVTALKGHVDVFLDVQFGPFGHRFDTTLISFGGIQRNSFRSPARAPNT